MQMINLVEALLNLAISLAILSCASLVWLRLIWMNSIVSMVLVMEGGYVARTGMCHLFFFDFSFCQLSLSSGRDNWRLRECLCASSLQLDQ